MKDKLYNEKFLEYVYDFYSGMNAHEVTLAYQGEINHQIIKVFTSLTEEQLSEYSESLSVQRRVYHVMIECLQNITRHAANRNKGKKEERNRGIIMVRRNQSEYKVITGNLIGNSGIEKLRNQIDYINSLEKSELDELFKRQILEGKFSHKGGAGLGFIDIKRKTGVILEYQFFPVSDKSSFFLFSSTIPRTFKK